MRRKLLLRMGLTVFLVILLSMIWEFWIEEWVEFSVFSEIHHESNVEKWEYVITSLTFTLLAFLVLTQPILKLLRENQQGKEELKQSNDLLEAIRNSHEKFISNPHSEQVFDDLLEEILFLTDSEFGFIGEILYKPDGKPYIKTHGLTNKTWDEETQALYAGSTEVGMEWRNRETLIGATITSGKPMISNHPSPDPQSVGLPPGDLTLKSFLGLPLYHGKDLIGLVGMGNRPGGFDEKLIEYLLPVVRTSSTFLLASRNNEKRLEVEQKLKTSDQRFRSILDNIPFQIYIKDLEGRYLLINPALENLLKISNENIEGKNDYDILPRELADRLRASDCETIQSDGVSEFDQEVDWGEGVRSYAFIKFPLKDSKGIPYAVCAICSDITERNLAEEKTNKSLEEKELLLKEIHHRTKNNMQIISSLLYLQSKNIHEEKSLNLFRECSNRIFSIALLHEKMYESPDLLELDFNGYLVSLVNDLMASYGIDSSRIKCTVETNGISLNLDSGIPCGLLIQELVSNSLKYAFPDGKQGELWICLSRLENEKIELIVRDNGVGFPKVLDFRNAGSLGLKLVCSLAEQQLKGSIKFSGQNGTEFRIIFEP